MMRFGAYLGGAMVLLALDLSSGLSVSTLPPVFEEQGDDTVLVLRYLAPEIGRDKGQVVFDDVVDDLRTLCTVDAGKLAEVSGQQVDRVIVAMMDREIARGAPDPEATQFLEFFHLTEAGCVWEGL